MGTNYYIAFVSDAGRACPCCKKLSETLHIGKSSMGWDFLFRGYKRPETDYQLDTWEAWKEFILGKETIVYDEYGKVHDKQEIIDFIEARHANQNNLKNKVEPDRDAEWVDKEGYVFVDREFC
jgi:hypothetical protein